MAQLAGKTIMTVKQLSVNHNTRTHTGTQCDNDKILHTASHTVNHLADSSGIGIVGKRYGNAQCIAEQLSQGHYTIVSPRQIRSKLDSAVIIIAIRSTNTHGLDFLDTADLLDDGLQSLNRCGHVIIYIVVATSLDGSSGLDIATGINNTKYRVGTS